MSCQVMELPADRRIEAARIAVEINPQNAPPDSPALRGLMAFAPPDSLTVLVGKKWGPKVDLGVSFVDTQVTSLKAKILAYANKWGQFGNIRFRESSQGEIRLARASGGYWSYLGTDILSIRGVTLNLEGFTLDTPDREYDRVVVHEFGHTLGFPHEHERQEIIDLLDREKTIAYFMRTQGWSRADVIAQIFSPAAPGSIMASAVADVRSIMCYSFPGSVTKSGQPIPGGSVIDTIDAEFVGKVYPLPAPPPPPKPPEPPLPPITPTFEVAIISAVRAQGYTVTKGVPSGGGSDVSEAELNEVAQRWWGEYQRDNGDRVAAGIAIADILALLVPILLEWLKRTPNWRAGGPTLARPYPGYPITGGQNSEGV